MNRPSTNSLRYLAALLIILLLLVQASLLSHEIEHTISGDDDQCVSCWVADHQHSDINNNFQIIQSQFTNFFTTSYPTLSLLSYKFNYYASRAPPSSHFN